MRTWPIQPIDRVIYTVLQRYMATVVYEPLNPTTIFSGLSIGYIAGNKTKNTMCGPPTTIGRFTVEGRGGRESHRKRSATVF